MSRFFILLILVTFTNNLYAQSNEPVEILAIGESNNDSVMAFDAITGALLPDLLIEPSPDELSTPLSVIASAAGDTLLVSDQIEDVVQEFDLSGNYLGVFAPNGAVDTAILDNIRGIDLMDDGSLLVTTASGTPLLENPASGPNSIVRFDQQGNYLGHFIASSAGGLISPFDVLRYGDNYLVGGITSDKIHRYDLDGNYLDDFAAVDTFPEQLSVAANGNLLVANFDGADEGILEYLPDGTFVSKYDNLALGGYRGIYELPNTNLLVSNGNGVHEMDRMSNLVESKVTGVSARYIEKLTLYNTTLSCDSEVADFSKGIPANWKISTTSNSVLWGSTFRCGKSENLTGGEDYAACAVGSNSAGLDYEVNLDTNILDLSGINSSDENLVLVFKLNYQPVEGDDLKVLLSTDGGMNYPIEVKSYTEPVGSEDVADGQQVILDLSETGLDFSSEDNLKIRFSYKKPNNAITAKYLQIDDIKIACNDIDLDGVGSNLDECPEDSSKSEPGVCGCGNAENLADDNGNGIYDCQANQEVLKAAKKINKKLKKDIYKAKLFKKLLKYLKNYEDLLNTKKAGYKTKRAVKQAFKLAKTGDLSKAFRKIKKVIKQVK